MATAKSTMMSETQDIQRRMAQVRRELHQEAQEVVRGAQSMTDWKSMVRGHPWLSLGIAATVGYLIVPSRRQVAPTILTLPSAAPSGQLIASATPAPAKPKKSGWGAIGTVFGLVAPIVVRAAQNYAMNYVEQVLTARTLTPPAEPSTRPTNRPGSPLSSDAFRRGPSGA
jgi:hypothetical protein